MAHVSNACRFSHSYPISWTEDRKAQHSAQVEYMTELWKDSILYENDDIRDEDGTGSESDKTSHDNLFEDDYKIEKNKRTKSAGVSRKRTIHQVEVAVDYLPTQILKKPMNSRSAIDRVIESAALPSPLQLPLLLKLPSTVKHS